MRIAMALHDGVARLIADLRGGHVWFHNVGVAMAMIRTSKAHREDVVRVVRVFASGRTA